ncbi:MAG: 30S ribosomal protein S16 [Candidatus Anoxychlamydiales bacterium]|nr:30S ribosomal protein S16 [Candidatus Anoxychlamydiales bacterium]NGX35784.1 30S ribosomal protein S16 [Candidatus Anoxychlamydiales bacterium]
MALVIRLRQMGKTNRQTFRLVVIDKRSPRDGKYIEMVGWYNPLEAKDEKNLLVKSERVDFWLQKGAVLSPRVKSLVKRAAPDIIKGLNAKMLAKKLKTKKAKTALKPKAVASPKAAVKPKAVPKKTAKPKK